MTRADPNVYGSNNVKEITNEILGGALKEILKKTSITMQKKQKEERRAAIHLAKR